MVWWKVYLSYFETKANAKLWCLEELQPGGDVVAGCHLNIDYHLNLYP
jgi:hypothetical protein